MDVGAGKHPGLLCRSRSTCSHMLSHHSREGGKEQRQPQHGRAHCSPKVSTGLSGACALPLAKQSLSTVFPHCLALWYTLLPLAPPPPNWFPRARKSRGLVQRCLDDCNLRDASTNSPGPSPCACLPSRLAARPRPQAVGALRAGGEGRNRCRGICRGISAQGGPAAADSRDAHARDAAWRGPCFRLRSPLAVGAKSGWGLGSWRFH